MLQSDERGLPIGRRRSKARSTTSGSRAPIGATKLDNAFTDLERDGDGLARVELRDPESGGGLTLWVDEAYPTDAVHGDPLPDVKRRSLAVEPMTCPPNAFRSGESLIRPGAGRVVRTHSGHQTGASTPR